MTAQHAADWMFLFACFAGIMFTLHQRHPSMFCPSCGYPAKFHKPGCRERR